MLERRHDELQSVSAEIIGQKSIQDQLFQTLLDDSLFDVVSLERSIIYNGFLKHERLIVARFDGQYFLVLEGNRRLTAVKSIYSKFGPKLAELSPAVRQSLQTLPCFVLKGPTINGSTARLRDYRRASEIYIGMRHLMGAKRWEPASRYEFQARLILEEGWTVSEVAERFGREKARVFRDLRAQRLYNDFRDFERRKKIEHALTYNAFAEAARAPVVMKWLGWSNERMTITHKEKENTFFHYLISRLRTRSRGKEEDDDETPDARLKLLFAA